MCPIIADHDFSFLQWLEDGAGVLGVGNLMEVWCGVLAVLEQLHNWDWYHVS